MTLAGDSQSALFVVLLVVALLPLAIAHLCPHPSRTHTIMVLDGLRQRAANSGRSRLAIVVVLFLSLTLLLSQPFHFRSSGYFPPTVEAEELQYPVSSHDGAINQLRPKRIAIVGAGASGSATAFFLRRAARVMAERIGVPEEKLVGDIVVFDKEGYIGGRE
jgi:hypothetical protein